MTMQTFAERLRSLREAAKMTRYALAKASQCSPIEIDRYEIGTVPSASRLDALARALGVSLAAFDGCEWSSKKTQE